jgi:GcrA cell cycle regulator
MSKRSWPPIVMDHLRVLWATGLSTKKIAGLLSEMPEADRKFTKNAVVGRAHSMELPSRPNAVPGRSYPTGRPRKLKEVVTKPRRPRGKPRPSTARLRVVLAPKPPLLLTWTAPLLLTWIAPRLLTWCPALTVVPGRPEHEVPPWEDLPPPPEPPQPVREPEPVPQPLEFKRPRLRPKPAPRPKVTKPAKVVVLLQHPCLFPIGDPKSKSFRFCGKPAWSTTDPFESTTYCCTHYKLTHIMSRNRAA